MVQRTGLNGGIPSIVMNPADDNKSKEKYEEEQR